jgi:Na+/H+-dicarboxylate symporter
VIGNSIATVVVSKWEGELRTEDEAQADAQVRAEARSQAKA